MYNMNSMIKSLKLLVVSTMTLGLLTVLVPARSFALFNNAKNQACNGIALQTSGADCSATKNGKTLSDILAQALDILSIVVGIVAVLMIIVGGLRFVLSGGDSNNTTAARNTVLYAIVGLVIVFLAQIIVKFVLRRVQT